MKWAAIGLGALIAGAPANSAVAKACSDFMPSGQSSAPRDLRPEDLVRLRDIGPIWNNIDAMKILALSPDGSKVAFQMRRADPEADAYCQGVVVVDTRGATPPILIDRGGEFQRSVDEVDGLEDYPTGYPSIVTPKWSPDGKWVAFLRRDNGWTQVWRARSDGTGAEQVTHTDFDVEGFDWSPRGDQLTYVGRPGLGSALADIDREGQSGFLFDERFEPFMSNRPFPRAPIARETFSVNLAPGESSAVSKERPEAVQAMSSAVPAAAARIQATNGQGDIVWARPRDPSNVTSPVTLGVTTADGRTVRCAGRHCDHIKEVWWDADRNTVIFLRREGWGLSQTGLYRWSLFGSPQSISTTDDVLLGCALAHETLICAHEASTQPREIVAIDLVSGAMRELFNPNPEFKSLRLGSVKRLHWKNEFGIECFGDLVLPHDHKPGQTRPLIVVQYESRGFLRGGTDDDYPIQAFAAAGYAVFSFQRPISLGFSRGLRTYEEINRADHTAWSDRRSVQSALLRGLASAERLGVVDKARMGITGLSEGANMVQYALLNTHIFRAAAVSGCCEDETSVMSLYGNAGRNWLHRMGYPYLTDRDDSFWAPYSLLRNAGAMKTPLLMQLADHEYLLSLSSFQALKEKRAPVEMYVFPDEYHAKWHPSHRLAVYQRDIDWFDFWLSGAKSADSNKVDQYRRWGALRDQFHSSSSGSPGA